MTTTIRTAARARHAVLSLTTKFRLPHEGMTEMEYLSRGSAFVLDTARHAHLTSSNPRGRDLAVLTCQHVACPWLFPHYFRDTWHWLQHVSEEFVEHSLQLLELPPPTNCSDHTHAHAHVLPRVLADVPLQRCVWLHPSRDVALLSLSDSLADLEWDRVVSAQYGLELLAFEATPAATASAGDALLFTGHRQLSNDSDATAATEPSSRDAPNVGGQMPHEVFGRYVGQSTQGQAFAWSADVLEEGMCGGAVVSADGDCVGLIEGIVPPFNDAAEPQDCDGIVDNDDPATAMRKALANHVAFVPAAELARFVAERGPVLATGTLLGSKDDDDEDDSDDELW